MLYPKDQRVRDVAAQCDRTPEEIYRLIDALGLRAPVGQQMLEGFFAQTIVAKAQPIITDRYGVGYG